MNQLEDTCPRLVKREDLLVLESQRLERALKLEEQRKLVGPRPGRGRQPGFGQSLSELMERIKSKIQINDTTKCHEWLAAKNNKGYGMVRWMGKNRLVHRIVFEVSTSINPNSLEVCHKCDNPACSNVDHLFTGTHLENMRDCVNKGRWKRVYKGRLSDAKVLEIIRNYKPRVEGSNAAFFAKKFSIAKKYVIALASGRVKRRGIL